MDLYTRSVLTAISQRRWFIAGMAALGLLVGLLMNWLIWIPGYQAEVELVIQSPALGDDGAAQYLPEVYHARAYIDLLESDSVIGIVRQRLIDQNLWEDEDDIPDLEEFVNRFTIEASVLDQTTRPVTYAPFLTLRARGRSEQNARAFADTWADVGVDVSRQALGLSTGVALETIARKLEGHEADLASLWDRLAEEQKEGTTFVLENELLSLVARIDEVRSQITDMEALQAGQAKRYEEAQARLAEEPPTLELFTAPSAEANWLMEELGNEANGETDGAAREEMRRRGYINEVVNEPHVVLQYEASLARMTEAEARAALAALRQRLDDLNTEKGVVQVALAEHERAQRELMAKESALQGVYQQVLGTFTYADLAADLVRAAEPDAVLPMGINRLTDDVFVREVTGLFDFRTRIVLLVLLGFLLGVLWVVYEAVADAARTGEQVDTAS